MTESKVWKVSRSDYLLATIGVWMVMVIGVAALVVPPLMSWLSGDPLTVVSRAEQVGPSVPELRPVPGVGVTYTDEVIWTLPQATAAQRLLSLLPDLLTSIALVVGGYAVLHAIGCARSGRPFARGSVRDVRILGLVVIGYAIVVPVVSLLVRFLVVSDSNLDVAMVSRLDPVPVVVFVVGLLLILLSDVFSRGARLEADVDGLV